MYVSKGTIYFHCCIRCQYCLFELATAPSTLRIGTGGNFFRGPYENPIHKNDGDLTQAVFLPGADFQRQECYFAICQNIIR
jgi:hypothetical protein